MLKTIKVSEKNWGEISKLRIDLRLKNLDEVVGYILKKIRKLK